MITVIILAKNERDNLTKLLPSLTWADSILVVDDNSTDGTDKVATSLGAKIVQHSVDGDFAQARNFALAQIPHGWVLFLDADERPDKQLVQELKEISKSNHTGGFKIQRKDIFLKKQLNWGETKSIWLTRFGKVGAGLWQGKVHETWNVFPLQRLQGKILHTSHDSISQLFRAVSDYALIRAKELYEQKNYWSMWEQITYPIAKLFINLIVKRAFLDGWQGIVMAIAMSWHSWLVRWYLWELPWVKKDLRTIISKYVYIVVWLLVPFGQLNRIQLNQSIAVTVFEIFMTLFVVTCLPDVFTILKSRIITPVLIFSLILIFSWLLSLLAGGSASGGLYWVRWWLYLLFFGVASHRLDTLKISVHGLIRYVGYSLLVGGFVQYLVVPDLRWLYLLGWDDHYYRMTGLLLDPNFFGLLMVLVGLWSVGHEQRPWKYVFSFLCIVAIAATFSRASYIVLAIVMACFIVLTKRIKWLIGLGLFAVSLVLLPKPGGEGVNLLRSFSVNSRIDTWVQAWNLFLHHPIFGIGFNQYPIYFPIQNLYGQPIHVSAPDNSLLYVLVTTGLVGFFSFVWMLLDWSKHLQKYSWALVSLFAIVVHSLFNNSFFYPFVMLWMGLAYLEVGTKTTLKK